MIHSTAMIDPAAKLDATVSVGPYVFIEGPVTIGPGCTIHPHARIIGPLVMGRGNRVHSFAVLGDIPQDVKFQNQGGVVIGDENIFRENVTVHRGTGGNTVIGSHCFLMVASHVGHNCSVGNHVTLVNGALLAGHVVVQDNAIIGGNCAVHQHCRVGRLAMISNVSAHNTDIPPFCIAMTINVVTQLNAVGLRRSGMSRKSQNALREMFRWIYRTRAGVPLARAMDELPAELAVVPEIQEFAAFVKATRRGVARFRPWSQRHGGSVAAVTD